MQKIGTILVAVDLSDYSLPSVQYAQRLAQGLDDDGVLVMTPIRNCRCRCRSSDRLSLIVRPAAW